MRVNYLACSKFFMSMVLEPDESVLGIYLCHLLEVTTGKLLNLNKIKVFIKMKTRTSTSQLQCQR